jgi:hypothetical protein
MTGLLPDEIDVLRDVSGRLEGAGISFMLTGSLAMNYYATPRMTRDIDVVADLEQPDVSRIVGMFESDYYVSPEAVADAVRDRSSFNLIEQTRVMKVDVFPRKRDPFRESEFARRREVTISGFSTWLVTAEDLVLAKLLWARDSHSAVQLRDVRALVHGALDLDYIAGWVHTLGLQDLWADLDQ